MKRFVLYTVRVFLSNSCVGASMCMKILYETAYSLFISDILSALYENLSLNRKRPSINIHAAKGQRTPVLEREKY